MLSLNSSPDGESDLDALLLCPVGVVVTGNDAVELRSGDGLVMVAIPAGSVSLPVTISYEESAPSNTPSLPSGYISAGRYFDLSARPVGANDGPVHFQQMLTTTMGIRQEELSLAGGNY